MTSTRDRLSVAVSASQTSDATARYASSGCSSSRGWDIKVRRNPSSLLHLIIILKSLNNIKPTKQASLPTLSSASMQFSKIFLVAATVASAAAAPAAELETRTAAPIKCQHHGGKWKYGWEGAADNEKYNCNTIGLLVSQQSPAFGSSSVASANVHGFSLRMS